MARDLEPRGTLDVTDTMLAGERSLAATMAAPIASEVLPPSTVGDRWANLLVPSRFEQLQKVANLMAAASLIPKHLRSGPKEQTIANCFLVANQALLWGMDPFAVASETYEIQGKLGFQGKLVAAVINSRAGLKGSLLYSFEGQGDGLTVTVSGTLEGEREPRTVTLSVKDAKTSNSMWTKDPEQKLVYSGSVKWARRHAPEVVLGVMSDDDLERIAAERGPARVAEVLPSREAEPVLTVDESRKMEEPKKGEPIDSIAPASEEGGGEESRDHEGSSPPAPSASEPLVLFGVDVTAALPVDGWFDDSTPIKDFGDATWRDLTEKGGEFVVTTLRAHVAKAQAAVEAKGMPTPRDLRATYVLGMLVGEV